MHFVRKIVLALLVSLCVMMLALLLVLWLINPNSYKPSIEKFVAQQGIELALHGDLNHSWSLHPVVTMADIDVTLATSKNRQPVHIDKLQATVDLAAALFGNLSLNTVELIGISSPVLTANDKPLPFSLKASKVRGDTVSDSLFVNDLVVQIANITTTANISAHSLSTSPVVVAAPLSIVMANNRADGTWQWNQVGSNTYASLALKSKQLVVHNLAFSNIALAAVIDNHQITVNNLQAEAYNGHIHANGTLSGLDTRMPLLTLHTRIKDVQLAPALAAIRQQPTVVEKGSLQLQMDLKTVPITWGVALANLSGTATFELQDLVMQGISPEQKVCEAATTLVDQSTSTVPPMNNKIFLHKMRGKADISKGVVALTALTAKLDALHAKAEGTVNLSRNTLDIRANLRRMNNVHAKNFCAALPPSFTNTVWPLHCEGNYAEATAGQNLCRVDIEKLSD